MQVLATGGLYRYIDIFLLLCPTPFITPHLTVELLVLHAFVWHSNAKQYSQSKVYEIWMNEYVKVVIWTSQDS